MSLELPAAFCVDDFSSSRLKIREEITNKAAPGYEWCLTATVTTDSVLAAWLEAEPPEKYFEPRFFEEHLEQASALLDRAIQRQSEIHELEERAISTYLDYRLSETLQPGVLSLSKTALKASRRQAHADESDATVQVLIFQDAAQTAARKLRLAMHSTPGHALAYGERIDHLRRLYFDSVRSTIERLSAAEFGLRNSGVSDLAPLPEWKGNRSDNLMYLVEWTRGAISGLEKAQARETACTRIFFLGSDGLVSGGRQGLLDELKLHQDHRWKFSLRPEHFPSPGIHRIQKIGIAVAFSENEKVFEEALKAPSADTRSTFSIVNDWVRNKRRNLNFSCNLRIPEQSTNVSAPSRWSMSEISLDREVRPWSGFESVGYLSGGRQQVMNANPVGEWEVFVSKYFHFPSGEQAPVSALTKGTDNVLLQISDIVLFMQVARWEN